MTDRPADGSGPSGAVPSEVSDAERRLDSLQRLGMVGTSRVGELDAFLDALARSFGAHRFSFTVLDEEVARVLGEAGTSQLDTRWDLARDAVNAPDGRAHRQVCGAPERDRLPALSAADGPVSLAAVAVTGPGGARIGALVAIWVADVVLPEAGWVALERAAEHIATVLRLRAEVAEYRRFVQLNPLPMLLLDEHSGIEVANPAAAELLGCVDPRDLMGEEFETLVANRDRMRVATELSRVLYSSSERRAIDATLVDANGAERTVSLAVAPLRGIHRHLQVGIQDLSSRQRDEEARTRLLEQLARAQRLDAVGQVAGGLAHDLNNLLAVMATNLELATGLIGDLGADVDLPAFADLREDLSELRVAIGRATAMTREMLDFSRRRQGGASLADVAEVVDGVRRLVSPSLPAGVRLTMDLAEDLPQVAVDPVLLERAVLNLVNNARDAVAGRGTITIRGVRDTLAAEGSERRADLLDRGQRPAVRLEVADDGAGMDQVTRARAFEPMFTTKPDGQGTGLGLPSVLGFVTAADGALHLATEPGEGTTVTMIVPADVPAPEVDPTRSEPVGGARILLVDPGEHTRRVITRMLDSAGHRVTACRDGEEALTVLEQGRVDLLLTELVLAGIGGARLIENARQRLPGLAVVVLASAEAPRSLDGDPLLVKPFSQTRLLQTVARVLGER